ncbi:MAG: class I tRNA ligase family protein, partial [Gemmatimonadota bacterium]
RKLHQTIHGVGADLEALRYNTAIAKLMEYVNVLRAGVKGGAGTPSALLEPLAVMLGPLAPHLAEESWERLGYDTSVFDARWPRYDEALAQEEQLELVVQVNGKVRGRLRVAPGLSQDEAVERAMAAEAVQRFVKGKPLRKTIYVPDRLVNLVV